MPRKPHHPAPPFRTEDLDGILGLPPKAKVQWTPAHPTNFSAHDSGHYAGAPRRFVAVCLHTPEEPADDVETTPALFARPNFGASTGYYADSDGDLVQMVRDRDYAWGQGTTSAQLVKPRPAWWLDEYISYNTCMLSIEIEGYADSIHETFKVGGRQFQTVAAWLGFVCTKYDIPINRLFVLGHYELSTWRRDPGRHFPWPHLLATAQSCANLYTHSRPSQERVNLIDRRQVDDHRRHTAQLHALRAHTNALLDDQAKLEKRIARLEHDLSALDTKHL